MSSLSTTIRDGVCGNLCEQRRQVGNSGRVRMQVTINDFCPFYGAKLQSYQLNFNSETIGMLSEDRQSRLSFFKGNIDGFRIRDEIEYKDNLVFVNNELIGAENASVAKLYQGGLTTPENPWAVHYAWDHEPGLFSKEVVPYAQYDVPRIIPEGEEGTAPTASSVGNLPKFSYSEVSMPTEFSGQSSSGEQSSSTQKVLMPYQHVVSATGSSNIHWSLYKRRPVFQGADFWVEIRKLATEATLNQIKTNIVNPNYEPLDVHLNPATGSSGELINNGVVETDADGNVIGGFNEYDLNKQVYFIVEIGHQDPEHNYFIIIGQNCQPTFIHVGKTAQLVKTESGSDPYRVVMPSTRISRRLSVYRGVSGKELLDNNDITRMRVFNHMGRIVIIFDGYEDVPWIIERRDLFAAPGASGNDPSDYQELAVPMVVAGGKLAIHAGNRKMGFLWGYINYLPQVSFEIPHPIHVVGVNDSSPSSGNIFVRLYKNNILDLFHGEPADDAIYSQDAHIVIQHEGGSSRRDLRGVQPKAWRAWGKGRQTSGVNGNVVSGKEATIAAGIYRGRVATVGSDSRAKQYKVSVGLRAGSWVWSGGDPDWPSGVSELKMNNVITPTCTGITTGMEAQGNAFNTSARDVSHLVLSYNETWSAQDYTKVDHSGNIRFLVNEGMDNFHDNATGGAPVGNANYLIGLHDKGFYITIRAWYEDSGIFRQGSLFDRRGGYVPTKNDSNSIIFRGFCHGGKISYALNERIMDCQVHDFAKVLEDQFFLNSPFFDSVRDVAAVHDILSMAGFKSGNGMSSPNNVHPASFAYQARQRARNSGETFSVSYYNGSASARSYVTPFALPGSYSRLTTPKFRFDDGSRYLDAIVRIANTAGKVFYFDRYGTMHFEDRTDMSLQTGAISEWQAETLVQEEFWSSPRLAPGTTSGTGGVCYPMGNIAYNSYTWQRYVGDVYNQLNLVTATPEGALISVGDTNFDGIDNPNSPGFLGYTRQLIQMTGAIGSEDAVRALLSQYTSFYIPALGVTFESFGRSHLKALDIVGFYGMFPENRVGVFSSGAAPVRITSINTEIDPKKNIWWSKIEGEWIFQGSGVEWQN